MKPDAELERDARAPGHRDPKPLYYQEPFLDAKLGEYLAEAALDGTDEIVPDEFVRWVFPALVAHRRPRYEALAQRYGYTLNARLAEAITSERTSSTRRQRARLTRVAAPRREQPHAHAAATIAARAHRYSAARRRERSHVDLRPAREREARTEARDEAEQMRA